MRRTKSIWLIKRFVKNDIVISPFLIIIVIKIKVKRKDILIIILLIYRVRKYIFDTRKL